MPDTASMPRAAASARAGSAGSRDAGMPDATEREVVGLARGGGVNLVGAICSQVSLLAVTVLLARFLGSSDVGRYATCLAFLAMLGLLALSGLRAGLTRFVAVHLADRNPGAVHGTVRLGIAVTAGGSVLLALPLFALAPWLGHSVFSDPALIGPLRLAAVALPAAAFTEAVLAATQGYRTMRPYAFIALIGEPAARLVLTAGLIATGFGLLGAMVALVVTNYGAAAIATWSLRRLLGPAPEQVAYPARALFGFSTVSWAASLATTGLIWADTLLLQALRSSAEVGVYSIATRLVTLATFVMVPINQSFGPRIAALYHAGQMETLRRTYAVATGWIVRLSLPAFVVLIAFPRDLLTLFGSSFRTGVLVTVILAAGKLVDAATGPCALMLNMSGRPALNMADNVAALALNVGLNLWLIPAHGIVGAAIAWAASLALVNIARLVQVWLTINALPFDAGVVKGIVAGAGALAVGLTARALLPASMQLPIGVAASVIAYLGLVIGLGVTAEDRLVLRLLDRRAGPRNAARTPG